MAGDWIKFEENTPDKPEVHGMAAQLGIEVDAVVGKLIRVWSWAGRNCPVSGRTDVRSLSAIDRVAFTPGFANAMSLAGWLTIEGNAVTFPNFDRHCSQTAKERALDQKRKRDSRLKTSGMCPDTNRTKTGPEKRREDSNTPIVPRGTMKDTLQLRAEAIFKRRPETPLTAGEERAFAKSKGAIEATTEADWLLLESFYAAPQSETFTRKDLATLVNNWNGEIDRARAWKANGGGKQEQVLTFITA
jgi:hypothetical protein